MQYFQSRNLFTLSILLLVILLCTSSVFSQSSNKSKRDKYKMSSVTIKFGKIGSTIIKIIDMSDHSNYINIRTDPVNAIGIAFDIRTYNSFFTVFSVDMMGFQKKRILGYTGENKQLLVLSLGFKYQFDTESKLFSFRPGYSLGYGFLPRIWFLHDSKHVTQKIQLETRMRLWNNSALMFEIVSFKTINGDDGVYDIEGGPAIMYRIGFVL